MRDGMIPYMKILLENKRDDQGEWIAQHSLPPSLGCNLPSIIIQWCPVHAENVRFMSGCKEKLMYFED